MENKNRESPRGSFQTFLLEHFPVAVAMEVTVVAYSPDEVVLGAPIAANHNVHHTGFAGSLYSLGALAGWGLVHGWLQQTDSGATLLIGRGEINYLKPVRDQFFATCTLTDAGTRDSFLTAVAGGNRADLELETSISTASEKAATFKGHYIALPKERTV